MSALILDLDIVRYLIYEGTLISSFVNRAMRHSVARTSS